MGAGQRARVENLVKRIVVLESEGSSRTSWQGARRTTTGMLTTAIARNGAAAEKAVTATLEPKPEAAAAPLKRPARPGTAWMKDVARRAAREAEHGVLKQVLEEVR